MGIVVHALPPRPLASECPVTCRTLQRSCPGRTEPDLGEPGAEAGRWRP